MVGREVEAESDCVVHCQQRMASESDQAAQVSSCGVTTCSVKEQNKALGLSAAEC